MTIKEIMERSGMTVTGRAVAYIKDGLDEMAHILRDKISETDINIVESTRYYNIPANSLKITDIRVLGHANEESKYRSVPRMMHPPETEDSDGV